MELPTSITQGNVNEEELRRTYTNASRATSGLRTQDPDSLSLERGGRPLGTGQSARGGRSLRRPLGMLRVAVAAVARRWALAWASLGPRACSSTFDTTKGWLEALRWGRAPVAARGSSRAHPRRSLLQLVFLFSLNC